MRVVAEQQTSHSGLYGQREGGLLISSRGREQPFESSVENSVFPLASRSMLGQHGVQSVEKDLQERLFCQ